jgi:hypothetical protein
LREKREKKKRNFAEKRSGGRVGRWWETEEVENTAKTQALYIEAEVAVNDCANGETRQQSG